MTPKLQNWLIKKNATPTEMKIYRFALVCCRGNRFFFQNGDILKLHGTSRTNIRQNLSRMIAKGLLKKIAYHRYVPLKPS